MNFVWLSNQFGNQIWQIAVATFFFGRGNFAAITSYAVPLKGIGFHAFLHVPCFPFNRETSALAPQTVYVKRGVPIPRGTNSISDGLLQDVAYLRNLDARQLLTFDGIDNDFRIVHVRGGDYLTGEPFRSCVKNRDWYLKAIDAVPDMRKHRDKIVLLTNDKKYAGKILPEFLILDVPPLTAFRLMMGCRSLVISASTFSWWAGYLNPSAQIACPSRWPAAGEDSEKYYGHNRLMFIPD